MVRYPGIHRARVQLAEYLATVEAIPTQLLKEGYFNADAHLMGRKIRSDLVKIIRQAA